MYFGLRRKRSQSIIENSEALESTWYDVYECFVDDHGIDFIAKKNENTYSI